MAIEVPGPEIKTLAFGGGFEVVNSAVHVDGKIAIVCVSANPGPRQLLLASFDPAEGFFTLSTYHQQTVLSFGTSLVLEPDYSLPCGYVRAHEVSAGECFHDGNGLYVRLHVDQSPPAQWPVLNLNSGKVHDYPPGQRVHVFKRWRLGVRHGDQVTWLLAVGAELANWASSRAPVPEAAPR
jgi:hypothetical protein